MRTIEWSTKFKKDRKREKRKSNAPLLDQLLLDVITLLVANKPLPAKFKDHQLAGSMKDFRACHLRPDVPLLYELPNASTLRLVRLGSHSDLFG